MSAGGGQQTIFLKSPALTREINRIGQAAYDIRTAIANRGVIVPSSAKIEDYADLIDSIALDMSNVKLATSTFTTLPTLILNANWSNVTDAAGMFNSCVQLSRVSRIDTSNITTMANMFKACIALTTIQALNLSNVENITNMFYGCSSLTYLYGLTNLGQAYLTSQSANYNYYKLDLSVSTNITHDSLVNVINGLYDIATAGCNTQQLVLGSTNLAKLSAEEIAIATNKGWSVS